LEFEDDDSFREAKRHADVVFEEPLAQAEPLVDETRVHLARVHLLFGSQTDTGRAASSLVSNMSHVVQVVGDEPGIVDVNLAREPPRDADVAYDHFTVHARRAVKRPDLGDGRGSLPRLSVGPSGL
jgi:hypothetical protein